MHWPQACDTALFRFINHSLSNPLFDSIMPWLSGNRIFAPLILVGIVAFIWRGRGKGLLCVVLTALAVGLADGVVVKNLKKAVGRERPFVALSDTRTLVGQASPDSSMPSSHAANWFAATMVMYLFKRRSAWITLPLAATVSFSRVYNGVHFPSDVLAGAILGAGCGASVVITFDALWKFAGKKWFPLWYARSPSVLTYTASEKNTSASTSQSTGNTELGARNSELDRHWLRAGYVLIAVLTIARWIYLASGTIELSDDEAYQWLWSKHPALSYYSKPPLIAYTQLLGTTLWGDNAFGVRFFSPLIAVTLAILLLRFFAREVSARAGFFLVLIVTTTPMLAVGATLMTVDPLAVLFWITAMLSGWRAVQENSKTSDWLWTGLWMGLGFLSKYTSPLQWMCWAVFFILWPPARKNLRRPGPYLALGINLLCTLPVLTWNQQHDWITVRHVAQHGGAGQAWKPTLKFLGEFLGAQLALLNPIFFVAIIIALFGIWRCFRKDARAIFLFSMGAPVLLLYLLLSLKTRVHPNWIAVAVLPLLCVMVVYWEARWREGSTAVKPALTAGVIIGLVFVVILHDTNLIGKLAGYPLPAKPDPMTRVRGWKQVAAAVGAARTKLLTEGKPAFIIGGHYGIASQVAFNLPEARSHVADDPMVFCQTADRALNQFYFWPGYANSRKGQNAIYVYELKMPAMVRGWHWKWLAGEKDLSEPFPAPAEAPPELVKEFDSVTDLGVQPVLYRGRVFHLIQIFECRNLR